MVNYGGFSDELLSIEIYSAIVRTLLLPARFLKLDFFAVSFLCDFVFVFPLGSAESRKKGELFSKVLAECVISHFWCILFKRKYELMYGLREGNLMLIYDLESQTKLNFRFVKCGYTSKKQSTHSNSNSNVYQTFQVILN